MYTSLFSNFSVLYGKLCLQKPCRVLRNGTLKPILRNCAVAGFGLVSIYALSTAPLECGSTLSIVKCIAIRRAKTYEYCEDLR